ncbi:hypothetical protein SNE40_001150 [Patella caerulea]|uniref:Uncharacterized protein n=1 Tax=Patella caerulea TaxID=87958 RepID=A0AAN8KDF5_PATCE
MKANRPVLNSDETFLRKDLNDFDSGKDFDSDIIPTWTNTFFGTTHRNFTEQWNNVKTRWHRNYGYLFSSNDSIQSSNPEKPFQNQLYLSEERNLYDNRSEASVITKEKAFNRRRRYVCVGVTIAIVFVLLACIISAVLIDVIFVPTRKDLAVQARLSVRITNRNYTEELSNKSSESFQLFQKEFCSAVQRKVNEDTSCIVDSVKNGSLIVNIRLFTTSTTMAEDFGVSVVIIIKGDTQDGSSFSIGVFQSDEIKFESSNLIVQNTIPTTAIMYKKDENTSPSTTEMTTSTVTSTSSLQPSPVEMSLTETSSSALQLEPRSTEISPDENTSPSTTEMTTSTVTSTSSLQPSPVEMSLTETPSSALQLEPRSTEISPDENTSPSTTEMTTSTVTSTSSLQPSPVEMSLTETPSSALQLEPRSTEISPDENTSPSTTEMTTSTVTSTSSLQPSPVDMSLTETSSSALQLEPTSLLSLAETSSKMSESSSNEEILLKSSYSESTHSSQQPSASSTETPSSTLQLERRSTDMSSGLLEPRSSESSVRTSLLSSVKTSSKVLESSSNIESLLESSSSEMIKSSSTGSPTISSKSPSSSPHPNISETSSTTFKSRYTATDLSQSEFISSESTFGIHQTGSKEEFSTVLQSVVFESSSSSNEASSTMLELTSPYAPSLVLESISMVEVPESSLQTHSTELPSADETSFSPLETSLSETSFSTSQLNSNDKLSTMLESSSALISSIMLESAITFSAFLSSSIKAFFTVLESSSANISPILMESSSSETTYSSLQTRLTEALSNTLVSSSGEIFSISFVASSRETSISAPDSSSKLEISASESFFNNSKSSSNDVLSTMLESITAVISSNMVEPGSAEITSNPLQSSSNEALSIMPDSRSADTSPMMFESGSRVVSYSSLQYSYTETSLSRLETSSNDVSFITPQSNSNDELSTMLESISAVISSSEVYLSVLQQRSIETSSTMLGISPTDTFSVILDSSLSEAPFSDLQSRSNEVSSVMLESSSADISSLILDYSPSETFYISLKPDLNEPSSSILVSSSTSIIPVETSSLGKSISASESSSKLETSSSDESSFSAPESTSIEASSSLSESSFRTPLLSSNDEINFSVSGTYYNTQESMSNTVPSSTQLPVLSLSSPYTLQPSSTEIPITTFELASSLVATTFEIQRSESSVNVMATTEIASVTSTFETPSPSLSPSSTQDIEMSSTFIPVITVRDTSIYQNEDNLTLGCNITNAENFTQIIFDVNSVEVGKITRDLIEIEPHWTFRNESNSDKQIYLMALEEANCTHSGNYTCSIGGDWGVVQQTATIQVRVAPGEPVVTFPDEVVEDRLLKQSITCSVDAGIPVSVVTWSVEFQDGRKIENFNFNPTEETNSSESCTNKHVSSFISTFNISWHNSSLCCNVDQGSRRTSICEHLFVLPSGYCNNRTDRLYDHPYDDCYVYVQCSLGTVYIGSCLKGGAFCFDEQSQSCSRAAPTTTIDPSQASDPYSCDGKINFSYIPVRGSCKKYIRCVHDDQIPGACAGSSYFYDTEPGQICTNDINQAYCTLHDNT